MLKVQEYLLSGKTYNDLETELAIKSTFHSTKHDLKKYEKGIIICRKHGEFHQSYNDHHNGRGCPKCSGKQLSLDLGNENKPA